MKIFFVLAALMSFGICYYAGAFVTSFDTNMCYSEVIHNISDQAISAADSKDPKVAEKFKLMIKKLPLQGYESNCSEILKQLKQPK